MSKALAHIALRGPLLAALLVAFTVAAIWLLSGVAIGEASRFIAFEAIYVLFPGCLLYVLLSPSPRRWLGVLAIGWPLGYALEMGAFALTADIGARWAFSLLPAVAAVVLGPLVYLRRRDRLVSLRPRWPSPPASELLAMAIAVSVALILLSLKYFALFPLPWHTSSIVYAQDNVAHIAVAAEARNHWPITIPFVADEPWRYYNGVFIHFAAINQITGVNLATVVLRLFPVSAILVIALQLWFMGSVMGRSRWIGPIAIVLFFVVTDLNLDPTRREAFGVDFFDTIPTTPTAVFGAVFFLGLLALLQTSIASADGERWRLTGSASLKDVGTVAMVGILVLAAGAAKIYAAIDIVGGLGLLWLWRGATAGFDRLLTGCLIASAICLLAIQRLMLSGSDLAATRGIRVLAFLDNTIFSELLTRHSAIWFVFALLAAVVVCVCAFTPLLGSVFLWCKRDARPSSIALPVAVFLVSFGTYALLTFVGKSLIYLLWYGYIAMIPVGALGLTALWSSISMDTRRKLGIACGAVLGVGLAMAAGTGVLIAAGVLSGARHVSWDVWYALAYGSTACLIVFLALRLQSHLTPVIASRTGRIVACCIPMICVLGFVKPIAWTVHRSGQAVLGRSVGLRDSKGHAGLTSELYEGLIWVRNHTNRCDVLAKNNVYGEDGKPIDEYNYFSAFTERRVYLEAWFNTVRGAYGEQPYPARFALSTAATMDGSETALRELRRVGVSYVLIDKIHGGGATKLPASVTRLVYTNSALSVYRLLGPASSTLRGKCAAIA